MVVTSLHSTCCLVRCLNQTFYCFANSIVAILLVPLIQVVFGLECALRSLRKVPFQARGKYDVTICLIVVSAMLIGSWIPTFISKQPAKCFASLLWFVSSFGTIVFLILAIAAGLMVISAVTIFVRLSTVSMVDQHQRIAASRMVYYLVIGIVSLVGTVLSTLEKC